MKRFILWAVLWRGFLMGAADIIPGISGGTVALLTGIYYRLISALSKFDTTAISLVKQFKLKELFQHIDLLFLINLFLGILIAIISMSHILHFALTNYTTYTWSLFFGLIFASAIYLIKIIENKKLKDYLFILVGMIIGHLIVSLSPVETPNDLWFIFVSGIITLTAMILPGISGSFLLLILGKYAYITAAIKNPIILENFKIVLTFAIGGIISLLSFSKVLTFLMKKFPKEIIAILIGFILGSLQKIWPWREVEHSVLVRGKLKILSERLYLPNEFNLETILALTFIFLGFSLVLILMSAQSKRGVSSAG